MRSEVLAGRYRLTERLGDDGADEIWHAWDAALDRTVAVRLLAGPAPGRDALRRFTDETWAAAHTADSGVAVVHEHGTAPDGRLFLVTDPVHGRSLAHVLLEQGTLGWAEAADLGGRAARALAAVHAAGVPHRAVRPANLLPAPDGSLTLTGLGVAVLTGEDAPDPDGPPTAPRTALYAAPELVRRHAAGPAADLYALGCVLYEALTGRPPFPGRDTALVLHRHAHQQPYPVGETRPDVPAELREIVHALLAKDSAARPGDAALVARRLQEIAAGAADTPTAPLRLRIAGLTQPLPRLAPFPPPVPPPTAPRPPAGRPAAPARRVALALGGLLTTGAVLLTAFFIGLLGNGGTTTTAAPAVSRPAPASLPTGSGTATPPVTARPSPPAATATRGGSPTFSPSTSPRLEPASGPRTGDLGGLLASALAVQAGSMEKTLYRETRQEINEIDRKLRRGETAKAAEKARDLRQRLNNAQQKGSWGGDAELMGLLGRLAASG